MPTGKAGRKSARARSVQDETILHLEREAQKFSAAHMTVFADGSKEALHGHNYQVSMRVRMEPVGTSSATSAGRATGAKRGALERMLPFAALKTEMRALCAEWDEKTLLPKSCPYLKIERSDRRANVSFTLAGAYYSLPRDEVEWLDCPTVSCETLSALLLEALLARVPDALLREHGVREVAVRVLESPRQGASSVRRFA